MDERSLSNFLAECKWCTSSSVMPCLALIVAMVFLCVCSRADCAFSGHTRGGGCTKQMGMKYPNSVCRACKLQVLTLACVEQAFGPDQAGLQLLQTRTLAVRDSCGDDHEHDPDAAASCKLAMPCSAPKRVADADFVLVPERRVRHKTQVAQRRAEPKPERQDTLCHGIVIHHLWVNLGAALPNFLPDVELRCLGSWQPMEQWLWTYDLKAAEPWLPPLLDCAAKMQPKSLSLARHWAFWQQDCPSNSSRTCSA